MSRPEYIAPPDIFYNEAEAKKYATNSRMIEIQTEMSRRAVELLALESAPCHILDLGCGSGLSGEVLSEQGHSWVGVDISQAMLGVAVQRQVQGDLVCADLGQGLFFRPATFDAAISISALQWLCNADKKDDIPQKRLYKFFRSLYSTLIRGARAVFQLYAENPAQMTMISNAAMRAGFSGGLVIDYPNSTKAKKMYLCLFAGEPNKYKLPRALDTEQALDPDPCDSSIRQDASAATTGSNIPALLSSEQKQDNTVLFTAASAATLKEKKGKKKRDSVKTRNWIQLKKERMRKQGKVVAYDSKYTARKRRPKF